jgi:pyruvate/2-oxoglutarate dehydrogenase complex dihydrolipoamide dehydrogenase (E3) component
MRRRAAFVPPIPGIERTGYLTSDTLWSLRAAARLVVLGGGPIGCELAQASRFGAQVTESRCCRGCCARGSGDLGDVGSAFASVDVRAASRQGVPRRGRAQGADLRACGARSGDQFGTLLVAVGPSPIRRAAELEELGIPVTKARTVETDEFLRRSTNIYACGDVAGPFSSPTPRRTRRGTRR